MAQKQFFGEIARDSNMAAICGGQDASFLRNSIETVRLSVADECHRDSHREQLTRSLKQWRRKGDESKR